MFLCIDARKADEVTEENNARAMPLEEWRVWQLLDSAFPTGGFAHSAGLEAAWQQGWIRAGREVRQFVLESVRQSVLGAIPFINGIYAGRDVLELDEWMESMLVNH